MPCNFAPAFKAIGPWCNGNTADFGSVIQGSSPCGPTEKPLLSGEAAFFMGCFAPAPLMCFVWFQLLKKSLKNFYTVEKYMIRTEKTPL